MAGRGDPYVWCIWRHRTVAVAPPNALSVVYFVVRTTMPTAPRAGRVSSHPRVTRAVRDACDRPSAATAHVAAQAVRWRCLECGTEQHRPAGDRPDQRQRLRRRVARAPASHPSVEAPPPRRSDSPCWFVKVTHADGPTERESTRERDRGAAEIVRAARELDLAGGRWDPARQVHLPPQRHLGVPRPHRGGPGRAVVGHRRGFVRSRCFRGSGKMYRCRPSRPPTRSGSAQAR